MAAARFRSLRGTALHTSRRIDRLELAVEGADVRLRELLERPDRA
jgi:hypothetical protein